jgi:uncharacterized protein (TIGR02145 family)
MERHTTLNLITSLLICICNIHAITVSGTVKDEKGKAISGAQVKLGIADVTTISGVDGTFLINSSSGFQRMIPQVSEKMEKPAFLNGKLTFTAHVQSKVIVREYDIRGRQLASFIENVIKGRNIISIPRSATGMNLYVVYLNDNQYVFRCTGSSQTTGHISRSENASNEMEKISEEKYEDYLLIVKKGYLLHRQKVTGSDTSNVQIAMVPLQTGKMQDGEGNEYSTIKIGSQEWTSENIRSTKFNNGSPIKLVTDSAEWVNLTSPGYCFYNNSNSIDDHKKWGALYNWYAAASGKLAPSGWHVPTDFDWDTLQNYMITHGYNYTGTINEENLIAISLSSATDWESFTVVGAPGRDLNSNNGSGFSAMPSGHRTAEGVFDGMGRNSHWWCTTEADLENAWDHEVYYYFWYLGRLPMSKNSGSSVRLVRD